MEVKRRGFEAELNLITLASARVREKCRWQNLTQNNKNVAG
jgi:hypothetical protein